jgi:hypothetical protein
LAQGDETAEEVGDVRVVEGTIDVIMNAYDDVLVDDSNVNSMSGK